MLGDAGGNCINIGLPGKLILRGYFLENRTSRRPFPSLRISFPGRPIFIQFIPEDVFAVPLKVVGDVDAAAEVQARHDVLLGGGVLNDKVGYQIYSRNRL